jgi:hypothetical protein
LETQESIFAGCAECAEQIENKYGWFIPDGGALGLRFKVSDWANSVEALADVCAAAWSVTAALFPIRINYYLMDVKRQHDSAVGQFANFRRFAVDQLKQSFIGLR